MNENSYLDPEAIKKSCTGASKKLKSNNDEILAAETAVKDFLNNSELQGLAFENVRMQMEDYSMILRTMRAANCSDISDFNTLSGSVGDEELDGAKILEQQREALRQKENYENAAEENRQLARNEDTLYLKYYYSQCEQQNLDLAFVQGLVYEAWKKKEEKYDAIDNATAKLFTTVGSMRSIAREGLEYMKKAYKNGNYDTSVRDSWRMRMQNCYFTRFMPTDSTGNTTINWDEIEKTVGKDASEITAEEYYALSVVYLNLDAEDLTRFLKLFIDKTKDVDMPWYNELFGPAAGQCNEDYSEWNVNNDKLNQVLAYAGIISEVTLKAMQGIDKDENQDAYELLEDERNVMLQRITVLQAVREVGVFRADIYADSPDIKIEEDAESRALTIKFKEYRNIGSESVPTFSNLADSSIKVKYTTEKASADAESIKNAETILTTYFGGYSVAEESGKFILDETNGEAVSRAAEGLASYAKKAGKTGMSKAIGYIPLVGDVTSFVIDTATDYEETKENVKIVKEQLDDVKSAKLYSDFGYSVNFVEYDTASSKEIKIVANHGENTINIINQVNSDLELDISENEIFAEPDKTYQKITDEISDNPDKQKAYNDAIESEK